MPHQVPASTLRQLAGILSEQKRRHGADALRRVDEMFDGIVAGRTPTFSHPLQNTRYFLPGLSNRPWHRPSDYPEIARLSERLSDHHPVIKDEVLRALRRPERLRTYRHYQFLYANQGWKAIHLYEHRAFNEAQCALVPRTANCLRDFEDLIREGQSIVSILAPGGHIAPHSDKTNLVMSFHFAVHIPPDCEIRVCEETRGWQEGHSLLFDYSFDHEAWNRSDDYRVCLVIDVWNPEITEAERSVLSVMLAAAGDV